MREPRDSASTLEVIVVGQRMEFHFFEKFIGAGEIQSRSSPATGSQTRKR
jgi:hypothetical protein